VEKAFSAIDKSAFAASLKELVGIEARFCAPDLEPDLVEQAQRSWPTKLQAMQLSHGISSAERSTWSQWVEQCVKEHQNSNYNIVVVSLKGHGDIPGDLSSEQMRQVAKLAEQYGHNEIRVTHRQNLVLPHVATEHLPAVWRALMDAGIATSNIDLPSDIIACPGLDYCALATARSIPIAQDVATRLKDSEAGANGVSVNISGCINACAHHHVASIGILGLDRGGVENYQITLGGRSDQNARLGERMGPGIAADEVAPTVEKIVHLYINQRTKNESFTDTYQRIGKESFKSIIYGVDDVARTA